MIVKWLRNVHNESFTNLHYESDENIIIMIMKNRIMTSDKGT